MSTLSRNTHRLTTVLEAWSTLRPTKSFAGMTLAEFKAAVAPSLEARARLALAKQQIAETIVDRANADRHTKPILDRVVAGVIANEPEGRDSALYAALGYIRGSDRSSGLTRRTTTTAALAPAKAA